MSSEPSGLLDRLEYPEANDRRRPATEVAAIQRHLQLLLDASAGNAPTVPDFGTHDLVRLSRGAASAERMAEEIRRCIDRFEPRLRDVRVVVRSDDNAPHALCFDIEASIVQRGGGSTPAAFRSELQRSGALTVTTSEAS